MSDTRAIAILVSSFHPLKAGRRLGGRASAPTYFFSFHPLKAGRRLGERKCPNVGFSGFHPLKAGRRLSLKGCVAEVSNVSIPSRRVGDT